MNRFFPLAALAVAPLAEARFNRLFERHDAAECCPCPTAGAPNQPVTVTVTQRAAPQTVTVERLVPGPAAPVYVTQNNNNNNINNNNNNNAGSQGQPQAVTVNGSQGVAPHDGPRTVAVPSGARPALAPDAGYPTFVNVTASPQAADPAKPSQRFVESPFPPRQGSSDATRTVTVVPQPRVQYAPPAPATVTVPPIQPQGTGTGPLQTVTQTVQGGGGDNIEIIIININTGETSCKKKHSGKPCHKGHGKPVMASSRPCPSVFNSTSIATVFNTVSVLVGGPSRSYNNGTSPVMGAAQATGMTKRSEGRKPRAPLSQRTF